MTRGSRVDMLKQNNSQFFLSFQNGWQKFLPKSQAEKVQSPNFHFYKNTSVFKYCIHRCDILINILCIQPMFFLNLCI